MIITLAKTVAQQHHSPIDCGQTEWFITIFGTGSLRRVKYGRIGFRRVKNIICILTITLLYSFNRRYPTAFYSAKRTGLRFSSQFWFWLYKKVSPCNAALGAQYLRAVYASCRCNWLHSILWGYRYFALKWFTMVFIISVIVVVVRLLGNNLANQ